MSYCDQGHTVSVDSYSPLTLTAVVGVTVEGLRTVTISHGIGGFPTQLSSIGRGNDDEGAGMDKLNEIETRLRGVENSVTRIDERLTHMPTTLAMWGAVVAVLVPVGIALWWIVQQYLAPILAKAAGAG